MDANQIATRSDIQVILERLDQLQRSLTSCNKDVAPTRKLLNQKEAAKLMCISVNTLRRKVRNGEIPAVEICNGIYRYSYEDLLQRIQIPVK